MQTLPAVDILVLTLYLAAVVGLGVGCRGESYDERFHGGRRHVARLGGGLDLWHVPVQQHLYRRAGQGL